MRVAIVHYHLLPGGVTKVIGTIAKAMAGRDVRFGVICGQAPAEPCDYPYAVVEGLDYDARLDKAIDAEILKERLLSAAVELLGEWPDVWHVHNHALGKNRYLPAALRMLAEEGEHLLLQLHDFAEDGRPDNYQALVEGLSHDGRSPDGGQLYPQAGHIHYATLNGRDLANLRQAGVADDRLHLLPNAVVMHGSADEMRPVSAGEEDRLIVYPSRAIRRKNLGEVLLWSEVCGGGTRFAVTMSPDNERWLPIYRSWVELADELQLPVLFEASRHYPGGYEGLLRDADAAITTSIAEGFGLVFLEPWLIGLPLVGRNLPAITSDFTREGILLAGLYDYLGIPIDWLGEDTIRQRLEAGMMKSFAAFGRSLPDLAVDRCMAASTQGSTIDFARLDEELQQVVIRRLAERPEARRELSQRLPDLAEVGRRGVENRRIIDGAFSLDAYGQRLEDAYRHTATASTTAVEGLDAQALLDQFLQPERFHLLLS